MAHQDPLVAELVLLCELLQQTRRRRHPAAEVCRGIEWLSAARDPGRARSLLVSYFGHLAYSARCGGDHESAAAFEMAADKARAGVVADVAAVRERALLPAEAGAVTPPGSRDDARCSQVGRQ